MPRACGGKGLVFQHQADALLNQANPVSGNEYEVLATTTNARIISISAAVTWTVQPTPLEVRVYIDGQTITHTQANPASGTYYDTIIVAELAPAAQTFSAGAEENYRAFQYEGRSVRVTAETTGGTVQNLSARVKYARKP